ncbi:SDR family NAD(P)-dependent oxidoreductase [Corynebacterium halotolerans]|uniref:SDR family NAD(P)-dependent oxidoreductase n=1 Tax=Corynebacterium halotolerans TaxID=225326 RepID=UPI003CEA03C3
MPESTAHKVAVVTGAAGGIGRAIAGQLQASGHRVYALDRQIPTEAEGLVPVTVDLADPEELRRTTATILEREPAVHVLVNCAGVMRRGTATELSAADWRLSFQVNVDATVQMCAQLLPRLAESGGGAIINVASQWGLSPASGHAAYNASKAAVVAFTRSLAKDHGHQGIRANSVCPGEILTPMVQRKLDESGRSEADLATDIPVGRLGRPEDVAALVTFLAGPQATFISGAAIEITGAQEVS